uniref:BAF chromatin remodeling complex subunit BCL11B n=1 Tax=Molossus molossus TaxID=27622 RepID=A0A7J8JQV1_MOLMO|nr:BAF chromatin remodeling complex subunit BCL11B [Molossus molossus]
MTKAWTRAARRRPHAASSGKCPSRWRSGFKSLPMKMTTCSRPRKAFAPSRRTLQGRAGLPSCPRWPP